MELKKTCLISRRVIFQLADGAWKFRLAGFQFGEIAAAVGEDSLPALINQRALDQRLQFQLLLRGAASDVLNQGGKCCAPGLNLPELRSAFSPP